MLLGGFDPAELSRAVRFCGRLIGGDLDADATGAMVSVSGKRCTLRGGWWPEVSERQGLEVLHGGGEEELIPRAGKTSQPHAFEAVVNLQVGKAHLDAFAPVSYTHLDVYKRQHRQTPQCAIALQGR